MFFSFLFDAAVATAAAAVVRRSRPPKNKILTLSPFLPLLLFLPLHSNPPTLPPTQVQEAHQRAALGAQPDPQPPLHALVVADDQPRQRLRRLPGPARPHGRLHARQDPDAQDLAHPDLPRAPLAEDPRVRRHGPLPGVRPGARRARGRDRPEGDDPPAQVVQDELVVRRCAAVRGAPLARVQALAAGGQRRPARPAARRQVVARRAAALGRLRLARRRALRARQVPRLHDRRDVYLPEPRRRAGGHRPGLQRALGLRQLVPGGQAAAAAGDGEDHEGVSRALRAPRAHPQGPAAVLFGAHRAVPELAELRRAVLEPGESVLFCFFVVGRGGKEREGGQEKGKEMGEKN